MSNSPLVNHTNLSPNCNSPRNHAIDTITIHCVVGQCSVETIGLIFKPSSRQGSSNYGIGPDGRIGMYVEEKDRSWCTSNAANDHRAITIEVASDTTHPYAITDAAYKALVELCADICKRNNIKELKWKGDKNLIGKVAQQNMTVHRWFANKACPGDYIYNRLGQIASEVNAKLGVTAADDTQPVLYRVQVGAFKDAGNAGLTVKKVNDLGFNAYITKVGNLYKVQVGAFKDKSNADDMASTLKALGLSVCVTTKNGTAVQEAKKKTVDEVAREVIQGLWGTGQDRKDRLAKAGYNYTAVQKRVNQLL